MNIFELIEWSKNDLLLLIITLLVHRSLYLSSLAAVGLDGNGLQLEKHWPICSSFSCVLEKLIKTDYSLFFLKGIP